MLRVLQEERGPRAERRHRGRRRRPQHGGPAGRVGACAGAARARRSSSTPQWRPASPLATTTAATGGGPDRRRLAAADHHPRTASARAPTTRSSKATSQQRPNLEVISGAQVTRVLLDGDAERLTRRGVEYRTADGADGGRRRRQGGRAQRRCHRLTAPADAVGHRPSERARSRRRRLPARRARRRQAPQGPPPRRACSSRRPGVGVSMTELGISMGPDVSARSRRPAARRPRRRRDHAGRAAGAQGRGRAALRRVGDHGQRPRVLVAVRGVRLVLDRARRPPHPRRPDRLLPAAATTPTCGDALLRVDPDEYFDDPAVRLGARRRVDDRPGQPGAAPQRGRDRPGQRRSRRRTPTSA